MATVPVENCPPVAAVSPDVPHILQLYAPVVPIYATVHPVGPLNVTPAFTSGQSI